MLKWLNHKVIEPSQSPWSFLLMPVKKKVGNGSKHTNWWCVDFSKLNTATVPDAYTIGEPAHNLPQLAHTKVFSTINVSGAFHQVSVVKDKRPLTTFLTPCGQFASRQLPFRVSNRPSTYTCLITKDLQGILPSVALAYTDGVLVHYPDISTHADRLGKVLIAHCRAGLKLNPTKCHFLQPKVKYLGHLE